MVVAEGDGGTRAGLKEEESLDAEEEVACVVGGGGGVGGIELDGVGEGLREDLEHEAGVDGEPGGLNKGGLVRDAGGGGGGEEDALLELEIAGGRNVGGIGNGGASGVGFGNLYIVDLRGGELVIDLYGGER